jgi:hypothetical protein
LGNTEVPDHPRYYSSTSGASYPQIAYYTATGGESTFNVALLVGRTPLVATRGGLTKVIVTTPTSDTGKIQIVNGVVTLPTGDIAMANELFTFLYN